MSRTRTSPTTSSVAMLVVVLVVSFFALPPVTASADRDTRGRASLDVSKNEAAAGERLVFRGRLSTSPGRPVVLQRRAKQNWVRVAQTQTSSRGRFTFVSQARARTTQYRARLLRSNVSARTNSFRRTVATTPVRTVRAERQPPRSRPSKPPKAPETPPTVLFSDDFGGAAGSYDRTKWSEWSACTYGGSAAYGNIKCGDRAQLNGQGQLVIPASPDQGTSLSTKDTFRATYGTFSARIKVPTQSGYWPAFWTLNSTTTGEAPHGMVGEADVLEAYTTYNDGYRSAAHSYSNGTDVGPHQTPLCGGGDIRGSWHDYAVRIEPNKVSFMFDGALCWSFTKGDLKGKPYAFGPDNMVGNFMLLSHAVGNSSHGMKPPTENAELLVDSVTVTALP